MISLTDFVRSLPGVRPIKARKLILDGDILTSDERRDIFTERRGDFFVDCIGPDAAVAILAAYRTSRLPMDRGTSISETPSAERYLENADALREQIADRRRKEAALKDISLVEERDFQDNRFLDAIFWKQFPKGGGATLVLAGIAVTKTVQSYSSNSGKSRGNEVRFIGPARMARSDFPELESRQRRPIVETMLTGTGVFTSESYIDARTSSGHRTTRRLCSLFDIASTNPTIVAACFNFDTATEGLERNLVEGRNQRIRRSIRYVIRANLVVVHCDPRNAPSP